MFRRGRRGGLEATALSLAEAMDWLARESVSVINASLAGPANPLLEAAVRRLDQRGIEYLGPMEVLPGVYSIYFFDPSGIRLELSYQPADGAALRIVAGCAQTADAMRAELETLTDDKAWIERRLAELRG